MNKNNPLVRDAIYFAYKGKCFYTGRSVKHDEMEIDHLIPVSKGGEDCFENYVLTFSDLNRGKSNKIDKKRIDTMKSAVEMVYAPRAEKFYARLKALKPSRNQRKPKNLTQVDRSNLFWADDEAIEILSSSVYVKKGNIRELLRRIEKCVEIARKDENDFCPDVWITTEFAKQMRSIWFHCGGKFFRVIRKTKYYNCHSGDKWGYLYFTKEYLDFLTWQENEGDLLEEIMELDDDKIRAEMLRKFCDKFPPPLNYREDILEVTPDAGSGSDAGPD